MCEGLHDVTAGGVSGHHPKADGFRALVAPSTGDELNTIRLRLMPIACWRVDQIRFAFDSSFVTPEISEELKMLRDLRSFHKKTCSDRTELYPPISVFGHADPVGSDEYNKALSGRRAAIIYGLIISNAEPDKAFKLWKDVADTERWGEQQNGAMRDTTGLPAGTPEKELLKAYMKQISPPELSIASKDFLGQGMDAGGKGDYQGCSEFNPLLIFSKSNQDRFTKAEREKDQETLDERNVANEPNRRVLILLFLPGSKVTPSKWPCPRASQGVSGCHGRFWRGSDDGEHRRSRRLPDQDRKFEEKPDTFACRFYQRLTSKTPCEGLFVPFMIRIVNIDYEPIADLPYELTMAEVKATGRTTKDGMILQKLPPDTTTGTLTLDGFTRDVTFEPMDDSSKITGAQARLKNLAAGTEDDEDGVLDEYTQLAIMRFQNKHEMDTSGQLDDSTVAKLKERYGS